MDTIALHVADMIDWIQIILNPSSFGILTSDIHLFQIFAAIACDNIWFARNKAHHENIVPNALVLFATINRTVLEHHYAWASQHPQPHALWLKPCSFLRLIMIQLFGNFILFFIFYAQAAICTDYSGYIIKCSSRISPPCTTVYGEVSAILLVVQLVLSLQLTSFILEGDSLTVTLALQKLEHAQD
jgi:hypothetical protein